jgi:predicted ATPase
VEEGLGLVESTCDRVFEPELWRLKGELLMLPGRRSTARSRRPRSQGPRRAATAEAAQAALERALEIARARSAKSLELRAALSLARLWQRQGKCEAAPRMLADLCEWFGEGFDTPDLRAARALIGAFGVDPRTPPRSASST